MGPVASAEYYDETPLLFYEIETLKTDVLSPNEEYVIVCKVNYPLQPRNEEYIFQPNAEKLAIKGILSAVALVKNIDNTIPVRVRNMSDEDIRIFPKTKIGIVETFNVHKDHVRTIDKPNDIAKYYQDKRREHPVRTYATPTNRCTGRPNTTTSKTKPHTAHENSNLNNIDINQDLTDLQKCEVNELLNEYNDIFSRDKLDIGLCELVKHEILVDNAAPVYVPNRRVPMGYEKKVENLVDDLLNKNIVRPSISPWNSPLVVIQKNLAILDYVLIIEE